MVRLMRDPKNRLDDRLRREVGGDVIDRFVVSRKQLPAYRFVDLHRGIESMLADMRGVRRIDAECSEDLTSLLHDEGPAWSSRHIAPAVRNPWGVGADEEIFLPRDSYWVFPSPPPGAGQLIARLLFESDPYGEHTTLEVAGEESPGVERFIGQLMEAALEHSIFRGQMVAMRYESAARDEDGDIEKPERLSISFKVAKPVTAEDFVVDDAVLKTLQRNVIDLHRRRDVLKAKGVPIRRGVLLYGPPGTGKTFATRYICGVLRETTRIVVTGSGLQRVAQIFDLARLFQPAVIILEDVDLVFASRDINLYSSALGDLLDEMDGLRPFEDISIVLTTNSIERMEEAIKDRPGRISQMVHFGPPKPELRRRYLLHYAGSYPHAAVDIDALVELSDGTTPAFIKEWVHRAVQIATERLTDEEAELDLTTADFEEAYEEIRRFTPGSTGRIVGFLGPGSH